MQRQTLVERLRTQHQQARTGVTLLREISTTPGLAKRWLLSARRAQLFLAGSTLVLLLAAPPVVGAVMDLAYPPAETKLFGRVIKSERRSAAETGTRVVLGGLWLLAATGAGWLLLGHLPAASALSERARTSSEPEESQAPVALAWATDPVATAATAIRSDATVTRPVVAGRYRVTRELGRGAMGVVCQAHDEVLQRDVALKELATALAPDPGFVERFRREAQVLAQLQSPHVLQVFDFVEGDGRLWMVLELIDGSDLETMLNQQKRLPVTQALRIAQELASALATAHARGIVHRDIKPANVLITRDGVTKLGDFGLARASSLPSQTMAGTVLGTPSYMSPEQAMGEPSDARSDVYALGATLFHLLVGRPPFAGDVASVLAAHVTQPPPVPSSLATELPGEVDAVVLRMLAKKPEERFQSGAEVVAALEAVQVAAVARTA